MMYNIELTYNRLIVIGNTGDVWNDPAIKPFVDSAKEIAKANGIDNGVGVGYNDRGMREPSAKLNYIHFNTESIDDAVDFTKEVMLANVGIYPLADKVTISNCP
jgi:hypothetical protein